MKQGGFKKRKILDRFVLFLNTISLAALLLIYLAAWVSPETCWPLAFLAMAYPIVLAATILLSFYWLLRKKWLVLFVNIALVAIKWSYLTATVQLLPPSNSQAEGIKVMTYNVRLFDYYNWSQNVNTRHWIYDFLFHQQPQILCFQEFYHDNTGYFPTIDTLLEVNSLKHMHVENYTDKVDRKQLWGMATLSSYPIVNKGKIEFEDTYGNLCLFTDLLIGTDTVRVYNLHLQSIRLGIAGYATLDNLVDAKEFTNWTGSKHILTRMIDGFEMRAQQVERVKKHINNCRYPVILCGDFNDVPTSYAYQKLISMGLSDSFSERGFGFGNTYVKMPFFRIDNILYSKEFEALNHVVHPYKLSDHLAVSAILQKKY